MSKLVKPLPSPLKEGAVIVPRLAPSLKVKPLADIKTEPVKVCSSFWASPKVVLPEVTNTFPSEKVNPLKSNTPPMSTFPVTSKVEPLNVRLASPFKESLSVNVAILLLAPLVASKPPPPPLPPSDS